MSLASARSAWRSASPSLNSIGLFSPAGESKPIEFKEGDADLHAERALAKLTEVALKFEDEEQPYLPLGLSMWKSRYGTYDHLARVKEWSVGGDDEEDAGSGE